jgi:hypothetical protein
LRKIVANMQHDVIVLAGEAWYNVIVGIVLPFSNAAGLRGRSVIFFWLSAVGVCGPTADFVPQKGEKYENEIKPHPAKPNPRDGAGARSRTGQQKKERGGSL